MPWLGAGLGSMLAQPSCHRFSDHAQRVMRAGRQSACLLRPAGPASAPEVAQLAALGDLLRAQLPEDAAQAPDVRPVVGVQPQQLRGSLT